MPLDRETLLRVKQDQLRDRPENWIDRFNHWRRRRIDGVTLWVMIVGVVTWLALVFSLFFRLEYNG